MLYFYFFFFMYEHKIDEWNNNNYAIDLIKFSMYCLWNKMRIVTIGWKWVNPKYFLYNTSCLMDNLLFILCHILGEDIYYERINSTASRLIIIGLSEEEVGMYKCVANKFNSSVVITTYGKYTMVMLFSLFIVRSVSYIPK